MIRLVVWFLTAPWRLSVRISTRAQQRQARDWAIRYEQRRQALQEELRR